MGPLGGTTGLVSGGSCCLVGLRGRTTASLVPLHSSELTLLLLNWLDGGLLLHLLLRLLVVAAHGVSGLRLPWRGRGLLLVVLLRLLRLLSLVAVGAVGLVPAALYLTGVTVAIKTEGLLVVRLRWPQRARGRGREKNERGRGQHRWRRDRDFRPPRSDPPQLARSRLHLPRRSEAVG